MSRFPQLSSTNAQMAFDALKRSEQPDWAALVPDHETHVVSYQRVGAAVQQLLLESPNEPSPPDLREFEAALSVTLHQLIPWGEHTGDKGFWRWIAFVPLRDAVVYRHGDRAKPDEMPDMKNYGIGSLTENLGFRCWIRGDIACDEAASPFSPERYAWVRVGDQDFWRSFLIRVRYSYAREMAKALLEFQHPSGSEKRRLKAGDRDTGIRMLAKRLTRIHANVCFAALTKAECLELLSELADGLEMEGGGIYSHAGNV